jgi:putative ATPase
MSDLFIASGLDSRAPRPLADRLRPTALPEVVGQDHLVGPDGALTRLLRSGSLGSLIFWGPPGTGKTTVARLLAGATDLHFEQISAVFTGVADLKRVFEAARGRRSTGQGRCSLSTKSTASTAPSSTLSCPSWRTAPSRSSAPRRRTRPSSSMPPAVASPRPVFGRLTRRDRAPPAGAEEVTGKPLTVDGGRAGEPRAQGRRGRARGAPRWAEEVWRAAKPGRGLPTPRP